MPSLNTTLGDLVTQLERLLGASSSGSSPLGSSLGSSLGGGLAGTLGAAIGGDARESLTQQLTGGLLGGTVGLVTGLIGSLFRGGGEATPEFSSYEKPQALSFDYDIAAIRPVFAEDEAATTDIAPVNTGRTQTESGRSSSPSVVVQVNALDAQSFSNRSDDIASAVREALTRSHALRDEIWED